MPEPTAEEVILAHREREYKAAWERGYAKALDRVHRLVVDELNRLDKAGDGQAYLTFDYALEIVDQVRTNTQ